MFNAVQARMERMVRELHLYKKRGLFGNEEIRSIVEKRREFEHALQQRSRTLADFMKYVEYEIILDRIREKRMRNRAVKDRRMEEFIRERIDGLFRRAISKFPSDKVLWRQYLEYFKAVGDRERATSIALKIPCAFPADESLWVGSALLLREYEDILSSRTLLQRAIRLVQNRKNLLLKFLEVEARQAQEKGGGEGRAIVDVLLGELSKEGCTEIELHPLHTAYPEYVPRSVEEHSWEGRVE
jgi:U3 small nucleolar RNA-associated protein 6